MEVRWSEPATEDLERICAWIERDNPEAARRVARIIYDGCAQLKDFPNLGRMSSRMGGRRRTGISAAARHRCVSDQKRRSRNLAHISRSAGLALKRSGVPGLIDKYESRRIRVDIRPVLMQVWDPIGIKDEPNAQDEYDGYLGNVHELLVSDASDCRIAEHLCWVVTERMELPAKVKDMVETVAALRRIQLPGK